MPEPGKLLAYLGGIRSGKSQAAHNRFAAELEACGAVRPVYLGTLLPPHGEDPESHLRIAAHRTSAEGQDGLRAFLEKRDPGWR